MHLHVNGRRDVHIQNDGAVSVVSYENGHLQMGALKVFSASIKTSYS